MKLRKPPPALVLFLLSPAIGELLSGSSPPAEFFTPFGFGILVSLYGSGAVVVRELRVRWRKGFASVLLLGAAYGVLEEGLMVCSFFNPNWPDLGSLAVYGRWLGVNWVWAVMLTIYHAVYSITIPILLVELAYPQRRSESWIGRRMLVVIFMLLAGVVVAGFLLFSAFLEYWPPIPEYLLAIVLMALFGVGAHRLRASWGGNGAKPLPRPFTMWGLGTSATFAFFLGFFLIPSLVPSWPLGMLFGPALVIFYVMLLRRYDWKMPYEKQLFALISGGLTYFLVLAPLQELDKTRTDNTAGMSLVGLAFLVGLILLGRTVWGRNKPTG